MSEVESWDLSHKLGQLVRLNARLAIEGMLGVAQDLVLGASNVLRLSLGGKIIQRTTRKVPEPEGIVVVVSDEDIGVSEIHPNVHSVLYDDFEEFIDENSLPLLGIIMIPSEVEPEWTLNISSSDNIGAMVPEETIVTSLPCDNIDREEWLKVLESEIGIILSQEYEGTLDELEDPMNIFEPLACAYFPDPEWDEVFVGVEKGTNCSAIEQILLGFFCKKVSVIFEAGKTICVNLSKPHPWVISFIDQVEIIPDVKSESQMFSHIEFSPSRLPKDFSERAKILDFLFDMSNSIQQQGELMKEEVPLKMESLLYAGSSINKIFENKE